MYFSISVFTPFYSEQTCWHQQYILRFYTVEKCLATRHKDDSMFEEARIVYRGRNIKFKMGDLNHHRNQKRGNFHKPTSPEIKAHIEKLRAANVDK